MMQNECLAFILFVFGPVDQLTADKVASLAITITCTFYLLIGQQLLVQLYSAAGH